jgi:hypothetical protein
MVTLLHPPLNFPGLKCKLTTAHEAIDYIDTRLLEHEQNYRLVEAARAELYRAEDGDAKSVSSHKLARALLFVEVNRA